MNFLNQFKEKKTLIIFLFIILIATGLIIEISYSVQKKVQYKPKAEDIIDRCSMDIEVIDNIPTPTNTVTVAPTNTPAPIPTLQICQEIGNAANGGPITATSNPYNYLLCFNSADTGTGNHSGCGSGDRINVCYTNVVSSLNVSRDCIGDSPYCRYYHSENCTDSGKVCVPPASAGDICSCSIPTPTINF